MDEIRTETINKKTPFARWNIVRKNATSYEENPKFRIGGKDVSIKDTQNAAAVDTNIYEVIEKYRGDLKMSAEQLNQFHTELTQELSEIKTLPDALKAIQKGEETWRNMPIDMRKQFGNSINKFIKDGPKYFDEKVKEYNRLKENLKVENQINTTENKGEKLNG